MPSSFLLLSHPISSAKSCHYAPPVTELRCNKPDISNIHYTVAHCCYACPPLSFTQVGVYQQPRRAHISSSRSSVSASVQNISSTNKSHWATIKNPLMRCVLHHWRAHVTKAPGFITPDDDEAALDVQSKCKSGGIKGNNEIDYRKTRDCACPTLLVPDYLLFMCRHPPYCLKQHMQLDSIEVGKHVFFYRLF